MRKLNLLYILIFFFSCERDEIAIEKHPMGTIVERQINMGSNYNQQIFYSASEDIVVSSNTKDDWDLGFSSSKNSSEIIINSSTFSQISEIEEHLFEDPISITDLKWRWDNPKGVYYGVAFNTPKSSSTYVIDRGYNLDGSARGYRKIRIDSITNQSYFITYAKLNNGEINNLEIKKDSLFNFQYLSFNKNSLIDIAPRKDSWDLVFTQYTHLFTGNIETPAYLVTGVLTNYLNNVLVTKDSVNSFEEININMIANYKFSENQDEIGYNWKSFDFENQVYSIKSGITYVIKDVTNRYFKMHFTDFYNDLGEKGHPKFEIQEL